MAIPNGGVALADESGEDYLELVRRFPLRPLRSDEELDRAIAMIDELTDRDAPGSGARDYLDVLAGLVEAYEAAEHPMPSVSDADMLRHLIDAKDVTQTKLAADTDIAESTISEVLAGKRGLSRHNIGALARYFHVSPAVFAFD